MVSDITVSIFIILDAILLGVFSIWASVKFVAIWCLVAMIIIIF